MAFISSFGETATEMTRRRRARTDEQPMKTYGVITVEPPSRWATPTDT